MRDIRGDLQDRVNLFAEQISAAQDQFDKLIDQLKREHEARLIGLKSELDTVRMVIGIKDRRAGSSPPASNIQSEVRPPHQSRPQPGQSHPDSLIRKVAAVSVTLPNPVTSLTLAHIGPLSSAPNRRSPARRLVGDGPERLVADIVSVMIVDCLEPIDIDQQDAQRSP